MKATSITIEDLLTYRFERKIKPGYLIDVEEDSRPGVTHSWVIRIADSWTLDPVEQKWVYDKNEVVNEYLKMAQKWA